MIDHVSLGVSDLTASKRFYAEVLGAGTRADGAPGPRPEYHDAHYAAFIRDPDGNRIEAVTFTKTE